MNNYETLFIVYAKQVFEEQNSFFAIHIFSSRAEVDFDQIKKSYESEIDSWKLRESDQKVGPFVDLEALQRFSFALCQRVNADQVSLLNIDSYNEALAKSSNSGELLNHFIELGDKIQNLEGGSKKGFLDRIFH